MYMTHSIGPVEDSHLTKYMYRACGMFSLENKSGSKMDNDKFWLVLWCIMFTSVTVTL